MNRRPPAKVLFMLLLLLAAGAIVNVAVAWGCLWVPHTLIREQTAYLVTLNGKEPTSFSYVGFASDRVIRTGSSVVPALREQSLSARPANDWSRIRSGNDPGRMFEEARGWPSVCLCWYVETGTGSFRGGIAWGEPESFTYSSPTGVKTMRFALVPSFHFPCLPIWPGFAINTVFYAGVLWLLFAVPFALRRRRRIKRGLCPKCAYDLRNRPTDSSACPECGAPPPAAVKPAPHPTHAAGAVEL